MTLEEVQVRDDTQRAHDYWMQKAASYEKPKPRRDASELWFPAGVAAIFTLAMLWAWSPTATYGASALGYSLLWTVFWSAVVVTAFVDVRRRDRASR